jgi:hypothetical protein
MYGYRLLTCSWYMASNNVPTAEPICLNLSASITPTTSLINRRHYQEMEFHARQFRCLKVLVMGLRTCAREQPRTDSPDIDATREPTMLILSTLAKSLHQGLVLHRLLFPVTGCTPSCHARSKPADRRAGIVGFYLVGSPVTINAASRITSFVAYAAGYGTVVRIRCRRAHSPS